MSKTLIILNPHAAGGRAGQLWSQVEPILWDKLGELVVAVTQKPEEVARHLDKAYTSGLNRVISIGGDGTNHALVNALADLSARYPDGEPVIYGMLPIGTGRDWARSAGIPFDIHEAAEWIANARPRPTDIGLLTINGHTSEHFLNIASAGLGGEVDRHVNQLSRRRPWTFLAATVRTILRYQPQAVRVWLDDDEFYEGKPLIVVIANGSIFGHGMKIAPDAVTNDGLFDVVLVDHVSRLETIATLRRVFDGSHLSHPAVSHRRARQVRIESQGEPEIPLDLDGEYLSGRSLTFTVRPQLIHLLSAP